MFKIIVSGSVFYETEDELIADAIAHNYRTIGWKNVSVKRPCVNKAFEAMCDRIEAQCDC